MNKSMLYLKSTKKKNNLLQSFQYEILISKKSLPNLNVQNQHQYAVLTWCHICLYCNSILPLVLQQHAQILTQASAFSVSFICCNVCVAHKPSQTNQYKTVNGKPATFGPVLIERNPIMCVVSFRGAAVMGMQPVNPKPCTLWSLQRCPAESIRGRK